MDFLQKLIDLLMGRKQLQQAAQGVPAPTPQNPNQNNQFVQNQVDEYMRQKAIADALAKQQQQNIQNKLPALVKK